MEAAWWSAPGAAWGRLASVRRSLAWASLGQEHAAQARYLGANCARLVAQVLGEPELPEALRGSLVRAVEILEGLDGLAAEQRLEAVLAAGEAIDAVLPRAQVGASSSVGELNPLARLLVPQEDGSRTDERPARAPEPSRAQDATRTSAPPREPRPAEAPRETKVVDAPREARPAEPVDTRTPLTHPTGGGAAIATLGVSAEHVAALEVAGICTVADLLLNPPVSFERPTQLDLDDRDKDGQIGVLRGRVRTHCLRFVGGRRSAELTLQVGEHSVRCRWQDRLPPRAAAWAPGNEVGLVGALTREGELLILDEAEPVGVDGRGSGWMPIYAMEGVEDPAMRDAVAAALQRVMGEVKDPLSDELLALHRLLPLDEALRDAHFPANPSARGRHRLAFEELLGVQIALSRRLGRGQGERGAVHKALHSLVGQLQVQFGLALDDEQEAAFAEIRRDLLRPTPMVRLLEGDVGTAKGLVAMMTAVLVAENRSQVAFIAHDAAAAERQYLFAEPMLRAVGIKSIVVGENVNHAGADAIRRGEAAIVFGTPRMVTSELEWRRLGLVVVLEHTELGTLLPHQLDARGPRPDLLVVSAGPMPPSLLLSAFGSFEISAIRRSQPVQATARVFQSGEREAAYEIVREHVRAGRTALVVFPVRDGRDLLSREDASRVSEALRTDFLPDARVGVFSSEMSREERARVFDDFQHHRVDVLLCTTMIEDGPPVPTCTLVVVEHADAYDLIRLHRLRGHVATGKRPGQCLLVLSDSPSPHGERRVHRLASEAARLELSDDDLGAPGGPRVTAAAAAIEAPSLAWAEFPRDRTLLLEARVEAIRLLREDNTLRNHPGLRRMISDRWPELLGEAPPAQANADTMRGRRRKRRRRRR